MAKFEAGAYRKTKSGSQPASRRSDWLYQNPRRHEGRKSCSIKAEALKMGTSGPYTPSPKWSGIKTNLTNALNRGDVNGQKAQKLVGDFAQQLADEGQEGFGDLPTDFGHLSPKQAKEKLDALLA